MKGIPLGGGSLVEVLYICLGNQPLCKEKISYIKDLRKKNTKYLIENKKIGYSNKS